ncbi:MAG: hypothetical protein ACI4L7_00020 [Christensenellales bacterium]
MKNKKLIFGGISLAGFVMALVGMFVPYLSNIVKLGSVQTSHQYELFNADLLNGNGVAWLTISKIAIIVLAVALLIAGVALIYSAFKKSPNWLQMIGFVAGIVALVASLALLGGMIGFGRANKIATPSGSVEIWGAVGFYLAFVGGALASVFALLPYFKKK